MTVYKNKINRTFLAALMVLLLCGSGMENEPDVIILQVPLEGNHIKSWVFNTGIFNQDLRTSNTPGFEWPAGYNKFAVFTTGLSIGAYVNGQLREAMCSYKGELAQGYVADSSGIPVPRVDSRFKFYSVKSTDNWINNPDWLNWYLMIPYGAPYNDVNHSGYYEPMIDSPGVKNAAHTLFICMTDGFLQEHKLGEGFGGGTAPLYAEIHLTAWTYNTPGLQDVQFFKWEIINKNTAPWNGTYFAIVCDPDLGFADDDNIGCDTLRNLGYCYNGDNDDNGGSYSYGINPPAVGFDLLKSPKNKYNNPPHIFNMTSFIPFHTHAASCEMDPNGEPLPAYRFLQGFKKDGTPWLNPLYNPPRRTKYNFSGDPETNTGWTEYTGKINNCGGDTTGNVVPSPPGDKHFLMSSGADNFTVNPGDSQYVIMAQFISRGTSNLNSVTRLKLLDDSIQTFFNNTFPIGVNEISSTIPKEFILYQNYPNPFNPVTKIKFSIPPSKGARGMMTRLTIYDILGKEVEVLINGELNPGTYEADWDASAYPSGVYFYRLTIYESSVSSSQVFSQTRKMVLIK